jgi:ABC-type polysaccharide/polyol phosphate export permease
MQTETQVARQLIGDVERVRRRSRARASTMWFPLLFFGVASLASAGVVVTYGGDALGPYWMVVGPSVGVATAIHALRRGRRVGVETRWVPYVAVGVMVLAGTAALGAGGAMTGRPMLSAVGPSLVVCAGYLLYAWLERSRLLGGLALALAALAVLMPLAGVRAEPTAAILAAVYGAVFLAAGVALVDRERQR